MGKSRTLLLSLVADTNNFQKGLNKSESKFKQWGKRFAGMMAGAAAAFAAFAGRIAIDGVKAAVEDQKATKTLAAQIRALTKATDKEIAANDEFIGQMQKQYGIADDKLRPAFGRLVRSTKDIGQAQRLMRLAIDLSAGGMGDLETVAKALAKAEDGNTTSLGKLGTGLDKNKLKTMDYKDIIAALEKQYGTLGEEAANTAEGKLARFNTSIDEAQETIGAQLLPYLDDFTTWATSPEGSAIIETAADDLASIFGDVATSVSDVFTALSEGGKDSTLQTLITNFGAIADTLANVLKLINEITQSEAWQLFQKYNPQSFIPNLLGMQMPGSAPERSMIVNGERQPINITINGAVDPAMTAKQVWAALERRQRYGSSAGIGQGRR